MPLKGIDWTSPRYVAVASVGCIVLGAIACGSEPAEVTLTPVGTGPAVVEAPVEVAIPAGVTPSHEGTLVMAGSYPVEVVPHASGEVYAYIAGDAPPPRGTELTVVVPVTGGVRTVELAWDAGESRWAGRVHRVEIVSGPVDVVLVVGGTPWMGRSATVVVLPAIVVAPVVVAPAPVVVYEVEGKHRKHRGHGHGHGRGHGHGHAVYFGH